jgi:DNA gyrase/topoisomerase IV, subunit A
VIRDHCGACASASAGVSSGTAVQSLAHPRRTTLISDCAITGQFGSRVAGGKDASSPRYIFTRLAPLARHVFNKDDDCLLAYLNEEGLDIEPEWCGQVDPKQ